jgi:hypothetical protein
MGVGIVFVFCKLSALFLGLTGFCVVFLVPGIVGLALMVQNSLDTNQCRTPRNTIKSTILHAIRS